MKNKRNRLQVIIELVKKNCIGSQNELAELLKQHGIEVTQATLSRDLKTLKVTKVANDAGEYMYIIPDSNELQDSMLMKGQKGLTGGAQIGFVSLDYSGNIAVIKTRNGYATGLAYDIDMSHAHMVLGTIAGADTVFVLLTQGIERVFCPIPACRHHRLSPIHCLSLKGDTLSHTKLHTNLIFSRHASHIFMCGL